MYYAYKNININPLKPVKQYGHIQQVKPVYKCHDDLHARIPFRKSWRKESQNLCWSRLN